VFTKEQLLMFQTNANDSFYQLTQRTVPENLTLTTYFYIKLCAMLQKISWNSNKFPSTDHQYCYSA